jgi:hypothetical protein
MFPREGYGGKLSLADSLPLVKDIRFRDVI